MKRKTPFGVQLTCYVGDFPEAHWDYMNHLRSQYEAQYVPVVKEEVTAYGKSIDHFWRLCGEQEKDLLITEPDIWPLQADVDAMRKCDDVYCGGVYHLGGGSYDHALGFTRFRWQLMKEDPGLIERAAFRNVNDPPYAGPDHCAWHWQRIDMRIDHQLKADHGIVVCRHDPVRHSHKYPMRDPLFP